MAALGVISEGKITSWRQLSPGPYCPNDLRRGLLWLKGTFGRRNRHHEKGCATIKICTAENKEKVLPALMCQSTNCTTVFKEKGRKEVRSQRIKLYQKFARLLLPMLVCCVVKRW